jgi:cytochrome c5
MKLMKIAALCLALIPVAATASERLEHGHKVYEKHCATCHALEGVTAPKVGKSEDWDTRSNLWEAILFEHANAGYVQMPAKGGASELTEYDVDAAAEYMLTTSQPSMPQD